MERHADEIAEEKQKRSDVNGWDSVSERESGQCVKKSKLFFVSEISSGK